jgi:hypothetical protein
MQIRRAAQQLRDFASSYYEIKGDEFDVVALIEKFGRLRADGKFDNPDYFVVEDRSLPGRAAEFRPRRDVNADGDDNEHVFFIRESVWISACAGGQDARETLAHELGHCILEHPAPSYARMYHDEVVDLACDSEQQANIFMDELLMDIRCIGSLDGWKVIADKFNVTCEMAIRRRRELINESIDVKKART